MVNKRTGAILLASVFALVVSPQVSAQTPEGDGSTSTTSSTVVPAPSTVVPESTTSSTSSTLVPPDPGEPSTTTTTVLYVPPVPPELVDDPRLPFLVDPGEDQFLDIPIAQRSFDPKSVGVLPERVEAARGVLFTSQAALEDLTVQTASAAARLAELSTKVEGMDESVRAAIKQTAEARRALRDHAVAAYVAGRADPVLSIVAMNDASDVGVAKQYMGAVIGRQKRLTKEYDQARRKLSADQSSLGSELGVEQSKLAQLTSSLDPATKAVADATAQLAAYEAGAHAYIEGFVFPVAADVEFIDSWGYPRMMGSASAHWHQGADIFAPYGAPLIASENGVIDRLGTGSLGGNKLWVKGNSGTSYYYAHLSAFAPGLTNGQKVSAGDLVGFAGDTGNAKGTSPHLHFEIHPNGGDAVNPYPLLRAAYGNRPVVKAFVPVPAPPPPPDPMAPGADPAVAGG